MNPLSQFLTNQPALDPFATWAIRLIYTGLFLILVAHFGKYVYKEVRRTFRRRQQ